MAKLQKKEKEQTPAKFERGYDLFHEGYHNPHKRASLASCFSCDFFYQAEDDTCELCQNTEVLRYDICVEGNRVYCPYWKGVWEHNVTYDS